MFELKKLSPEGIDSALDKAHRYRLLNEPWEASSICRDVLEVDPNNQRALVMLLLATTDRFTNASRGVVATARELLERLETEYDRQYYAGIIAERRGKAILSRAAPGHGPIVYDWLHDAMEHYAKAEALRPAGNDDAILRWNTCARLIEHHREVRPLPGEPVDTMLE